MFDKKYLVKIYREGENVPAMQFMLVGVYVVVEGHSIHADTTRLYFAENEYITVEQVR